MKKIKKENNILRLCKLTYIKIFRINDAPQKIALGLGLGVFLGIIPGTGPLAALFLAFAFRVNRAAALLGSLLTNTWLSIVAFLLSVKIGSWVMRVSWQEVRLSWYLFLREFKWSFLLKLSALKIILPVIVGYFIVAFCAGLMVYLIMLVLISRKKDENKSRVYFSQ
jgi:uncharacterized protein (DUF2062 family)